MNLEVSNIEEAALLSVSGYEPLSASINEGAHLSVAIYREDGTRVLESLVLENGPDDAINPVKLPAGRYYLAWASVATSDVRCHCGTLDKELQKVLNSGEGSMVVGIGKGRRGHQLPKTLPALSPQDRDLNVPRLVMKA